MNGSKVAKRIERLPKRGSPDYILLDLKETAAVLGVSISVLKTCAQEGTALPDGRTLPRARDKGSKMRFLYQDIMAIAALNKEG